MLSKIAHGKFLHTFYKWEHLSDKEVTNQAAVGDIHKP